MRNRSHCSRGRRSCSRLPTRCSGRATETAECQRAHEVTAAQLLKARPVWATPVVVGSVLVTLMTLLYFGSIVEVWSEHQLRPGDWGVPGPGPGRGGSG